MIKTPITKICLKIAHLKSQSYLPGVKNLKKCFYAVRPHYVFSLQWRHNELTGVSNHQPQDCLLSRLFGRRLKKSSKLRVTGLCKGNSPVTGEFPAQSACNADNVSIWWRHHESEQPMKRIDHASSIHISVSLTIYNIESWWVFCIFKNMCWNITFMIATLCLHLARLWKHYVSIKAVNINKSLLTRY